MSEINTATISLDRYFNLQKIEKAYQENHVVIYDYYSRGMVYSTANRDEKLADLAEKLRKFDRKYETLLDKKDELSKENEQMKDECEKAYKIIRAFEEDAKKDKYKDLSLWQFIKKKYFS